MRQQKIEEKNQQAEDYKTQKVAEQEKFENENKEEIEKYQRY